MACKEEKKIEMNKTYIIYEDIITHGYSTTFPFNKTERKLSSQECRNKKEQKKLKLNFYSNLNPCLSF